MKTITTNKNLLAALLVATTLVVSGCHHAPAPAAQTQSKMSLKHNFGKENVKTALTNAAKDNGWSVANAGENLLISKSFTKKETDKNARGRTWNKVSVTQEINADVVVNANSYEINIKEEDRAFFSNDMAKTQLNAELHRLQNAISLELVHDIL